jgi:hypothetical protein
VGSIPIARSTFRCLACPCVALARDLAYRPVPTVSTGLQPFPLIECVEVAYGRGFWSRHGPLVIGRESAKIVALRFPRFSACISVRSERSNGTNFHPHNADI